MPPLPDLKHLYLSDNALTSLAGLGVQPVLEELDVSGNELTSLAGARPQPRLKSVLLARNPIASHVHFRTMTLLAFGWQLRSIDGIPVTAAERRAAKGLAAPAPGLLVDLISAGWLLDLKPRTKAEMRALLDDILSGRSQDEVPVPILPLEAALVHSVAGSLVARPPSADPIPYSWSGPGYHIPIDNGMFLDLSLGPPPPASSSRTPDEQ